MSGPDDSTCVSSRDYPWIISFERFVILANINLGLMTSTHHNSCENIENKPRKTPLTSGVGYCCKIRLWFGSDSQNRARKSSKNTFFRFGQKNWLGYCLGYLKIIKLCPNSQNSIFENFLCVG